MKHTKQLKRVNKNKNLSQLKFNAEFCTSDQVCVDVLLDDVSVYIIKFDVAEDFSIDDGEDEDIYGITYSEELKFEAESDETRKVIRDFLFHKTMDEANQLVQRTKSEAISRSIQAIKSAQVNLFDIKVNHPDGSDDFTFVELYFSNDQFKFQIADVIRSTNTYEPSIDPDGKISTWYDVRFHPTLEITTEELTAFYKKVFELVDGDVIDPHAEHVQLCLPTQEEADEYGDENLRFEFTFTSKNKGDAPTPLQQVEYAYLNKNDSAFHIHAFVGDYNDLYAEVRFKDGNHYLGIIQFTLDDDNDLTHDSDCQYFEYAELGLSDSNYEDEIYHYLFHLAKKAAEQVVDGIQEKEQVDATNALINMDITEIDYDYSYQSSLKKTYIRAYYSAPNGLCKTKLAELVFEEHTHYFEEQEKTLVDVKYFVPLGANKIDESQLADAVLSKYENLIAHREVTS